VNCFSQVFENTAGAREKRFIYEVKQIDEFFERFNDDSSSFIREVYRSYRTKFNIDRASLIKSLFNYETKTWSQGIIDSFVNTALSTQMPSRNNFYGENWFAEAGCKFLYQSVEIEIPVILRIFTDEQRRSRWVIIGVRSHSIRTESAAIPNTSEKNKQKFISPSSHANYFIELGKVFDDKENLNSYFENSLLARKNALVFYNAILQDKIKFMHVKSIRYHFLQVSNYIFTVEHFQRKELNAGWLINSLQHVSVEDKKNFTKKLLGE
jgi:hypothetical protein